MCAFLKWMERSDTCPMCDEEISTVGFDQDKRDKWSIFLGRKFKMLWSLCPVRWPPHPSEATSRLLFSLQVPKSCYSIDTTLCLLVLATLRFLVQGEGKMQWHLWWVHHDSILLFLILVVILDVIHSWRWLKLQIHRNSSAKTSVSQLKQKLGLGIASPMRALSMPSSSKNEYKDVGKRDITPNKPHLVSIPSLLVVRG